jgi:DNA-binding MarR family transcriptional regulator
LADQLSFDPIDEAGRQWRKHWGASTVAPMTAVTSIMRVQQILLARLNEELRPFGLTFARYEALMLLYYSRRGSLPLGKMGARLQVHRTSVTNLVDGLETMGLAERTPHPTDRRTTLATITGQGRGVAKAATEALNESAFGSRRSAEATSRRSPTSCAGCASPPATSARTQTGQPARATSPGATARTSLPVCVRSSIRRCASGASASGRASYRGRSLPSRTRSQRRSRLREGSAGSRSVIRARMKPQTVWARGSSRRTSSMAGCWLAEPATT